MRVQNTSRHGSGRRGFALPAAIFALVVVAVLVTGGLYVAGQESRIGMSTERGAQAFYVAESAMHEFLAEWNPATTDLDVWGDELARSGTNGGANWDIRVARVHDRLYLLRSTGAVPTTGGNEAVRRLGMFVRHTTIDLDPPAALTTRGTVQVSGSAQIRGEDQHPSNWSGDLCPDPLENTPGIVTDVGGSVNTSGQAQVSGEPAHVADPDLSEDDFTQFGDMDWDELTSLATITLPGGSIDPMAPSITPTGQCNLADSQNWGDPLGVIPTGVCDNYFPIVHITGTANIQSGGVGQGILLVDGDLDLRGGFQFFGIIIVQGAFNVQGGGAQGPRISGGVLARNANLDTQSTVGSSIVNNSRCAIQRAITNNQAVNRAIPLAERSWVDLTGASF